MLLQEMGDDLQGMGIAPMACGDDFEMMGRQPTAFQRDPAMMTGQTEAVGEPKVEAALPAAKNVNDQNNENDDQHQEAAYDQMIKDINRNSIRQERQKSELIVNKKTENS